jgi:6,7-dimethyl-8-ribityllumazine synthase
MADLTTAELKTMLVAAGFSEDITDDLVEDARPRLRRFFQSDEEMLAGLKRWAEQEKQK